MKQILDFLKKQYKLYILVGICVVLGVLVECAFYLPILMSKDKGTFTYESSQLGFENMEPDDNGIMAVGKNSVIHIPIGDKYVDKLYYTYAAVPEGKLLNTTITVMTYDIYGNPSVEGISDSNPFRINTSVVTVRKKCSEICISFNEEVEGAVISNIKVVNKFHFNYIRFMFFTTLFIVIGFILMYRNVIGNKTENLFLVVGGLAGLVFVLAMPLSKVGFDEEAHFRGSYKMILSSNVSSTTAIDELTVVSLSNWPYNLNQSLEERREMSDYWDTYADYTKDSGVSYKTPTLTASMATPSYIFMALGIKLAKLFHLPFAVVYTVGRLVNMIMFITLVYFAIKKMPVGKRIMAAIALTPTAMFQASVYSYDPVLTGFVFLGLAYFFDELLDKERKISVKSGVIILATLTFGLLMKAVYFPLIFIGFMFKKDKFKNKKERIIFRCANILCFFVLVAGIIAPAFLTSGGIADSRGGNVDLAGQVKLILGQPFSYLSVWLNNFFTTLVSYTFGEGSLGTMGHIAASTCVPFIGLFMIYVIFTDTTYGDDKVITIRQKVVLSIVSILSIACVWGTLYLTFNEVGATYIGGVQGRYYVPFLLILYLVLNNKKIRNNMKLGFYNTTVFGFAAFILYKTIYDCVLLPYCF